MRISEQSRTTRETSVQVRLNIDGSGQADVDTGCGFLDHMLELVAVHGGMDLYIRSCGDQQVDDHHLVEDTGLVLGRCLLEALGDRAGILRYGMALIPMDESLARCVVDISGRPWIEERMTFSSQRVGMFDTELVLEFFTALVREARITLHLELLYGKNTHHQIEAVFKAFARSLRMACQKGSDNKIPSSKGVLT